MNIVRIQADGTDGVLFLQPSPYAYGPAQPHFTDVTLTFEDNSSAPGVLWIDQHDNISITGRRDRPAGGGSDVQQYPVPEKLDAGTVRDMFRDIEEAETREDVDEVLWQAPVSA